jgi:prepilin-type N-terminal cleavage/methylation domain-containing protein/prepilin-type processing-associated H-X9-DG protein
MKRHGFTLLELLVVLAIVAIMSALAMPALARAKMLGKQVVCLSNLKQVTTAGVMFLDETHGVFPYNIPGNSTYDPAIAPLWFYALTNYGATVPALVCPSTRQPTPFPVEAAGTADLAWITEASGDHPQVCSYGQNGWFTEFITYAPPALGGGQYSQFFFPKFSSVLRPAQTPLFFDQNYCMTIPLETDSAASDLYYGQTNPDGIERVGMGCCTMLRHGGPTASGAFPYQSRRSLPGAINMSFADGHGQLTKLNDLWNCEWHLNWNRSLVQGP